ncbi:MAG: DnaJ domain-containing protein [Candidatus Sumerlaeaceae bacterium]|nr:DnaJ domain-containing protein [Candidatus Sumerlaeaceae bacterium]
MSKTHYEILGVPKTADIREIQMAYHRLAQKYHPDKADTPEKKREFEQHFGLVSAAYNVLKDKEKRAAYDRSLANAGGASISPAEAPKPDETGGRTRSPGSSGTMPKAGTGGQTPGGFDQNKASVARRAFNGGKQCFAAGDYVKATEFFEVAVKNNDSEATYFSHLAMALLRSRRGFTRAVEAAKRAIEIDPYNSEHRLILAELYEAINSRSMAIATYEEILKWDPENARAKAALAALRPNRAKSIFGRLFRKK